MHQSLSRRGYILKKDQLSKQELAKIKKELTVKPVVLAAFKEFQKVKPYPVFLESPERLYIPRFYGIDKFGPPTKTKLTPGLPISINDKISLKPHQHKAFRRLLEQFDIEVLSANNTNGYANPTESFDIAHLDSKDVRLKESETGGGGVLCLPCGFGKTILAIKAICCLKKKTLVLVNKEFLMEQWVDRIEEFTDAKVGILQQNRVEVEGRDIVVGMLHSVCLKDYPQELFDQFGLVIIDEVHHVASEMFSKSLPKVAAKYMLGLSATPNRKDGLSRVFYHYLGELFHSEKREGKNAVIVKQITIKSTSPHYNNLFLSNGVKNTAGMISQLSEFEARNIMIIGILKQLVEMGRKILVLSSRREHLEHFMELLEKASIRTPQNKFVTYGLYYGKTSGMNKVQYKKMLAESAKCDIVLGTHQMASEALDIPELNTLLFATPANEVEQAVGRILRKFHKDINPLVIDIIDKFGNFAKHSKNREKLYIEENYQIENFNMILSDNDVENNYQSALTKYLSEIKIKNINPPTSHPKVQQTKINLDAKSKINLDKQQIPKFVLGDDDEATSLDVRPSSKMNLNPKIKSASPVAKKKKTTTIEIPVQKQSTQIVKRSIKAVPKPKKKALPLSKTKATINNEPATISIKPSPIKKNLQKKTNQTKNLNPPTIVELPKNQHTKLIKGACLLED